MATSRGTPPSRSTSWPRLRSLTPKSPTLRRQLLVAHRLSSRPATCLNFAYDAGRLKYTLNVDNLLDKEYIYAARNQALIIPGTGFNVKAGVTWKF